LKLARAMLFLQRMKSSFKLLFVLSAATAFFLVQPAKADRTVQAGPSVVSVPDTGSTVSLLGLAFLGLTVLRRKLGR
jgi:hypothetical protein